MEKSRKRRAFSRYGKSNACVYTDTERYADTAGVFAQGRRATSSNHDLVVQKKVRKTNFIIASFLPYIVPNLSIYSYLVCSIVSTAPTL